MLNLYKYLFCVCSLLLWFPGFAGDIPLRGPIPFESFDTNGDNKIDPAEYVKAHNLRIKMRNDAGMPAKRRATPSFTDFDSNGDSLISRQELQKGHSEMSRGGQQGQGMRGGGQGTGMGPGSGMGQGRNMPSFSDFDLNGDGVVLKQEFYDARANRMYRRADEGYALRNAANAPSFESVDENNDGKIDPKEFKQHQTEHHQSR